MQPPSPVRGAQEIPLYRFIWPSRDRRKDPYGKIADIKIDARNGEVVYLSLWDRAFFDPSWARRINELVCRPDPRPKPHRWLPDRERFPMPTTNQARIGISNAARLCRKLGLDLGEDTTLGNVQWDTSYIYNTGRFEWWRGIDPARAKGTLVCQIRLRGGARIECVGPLPTACISGDSAYVGAWDDKPPEYWRGFHGTVKKRWQYLAKALEDKLKGRLGVPVVALSRLHPELAYSVPEYGAEGTAHCVVRWHDPVQDERMNGTGFEASGAFAAEFDLQSGDLKWLAFYDLALLSHWDGQ